MLSFCIITPCIVNVNKYFQIVSRKYNIYNKFLSVYGSHRLRQFFPLGLCRNGKGGRLHSFSAVNDPFAQQSLPLAFVSRDSGPLSPCILVIRRNTRSRPRSDVVARILQSRDFLLILKRFLICQLAFSPIFQQFFDTSSWNP